MRKTKEAKRKEARVEITLPDGTHIVARGPMAEIMARRLTDQSIPYYWNHHWPVWYGSNTISSGTVTSVTPAVYLEQSDGTRLENATVAQVGAAIDKGLNS